MYRHCIFCSANLGKNDAVEAFPVGRSVAFDAWKGRLWAVCPKCARWNLAPLEERWEAVEAAERLFRDARLRVQAENVGLAHLPDRTRLIRVGEALPGELAAWRYGGELRRRHTRYWWRTASLVALGDVGLIVALTMRDNRSRAILHRLPPADSPTGTELHIRGRHLPGARLLGGSRGEGPRLELVATATLLPRTGAIQSTSAPPITLEGAAVPAVLSRALVQVNRRGAHRKRLDQALELLAGAGSAAACIAELGGISRDAPATLRFRTRVGGLHVERDSPGRSPGPAAGVAALALEMALHEEAERRAMDEELTSLQLAWREAEEIAGIADALPDG